jgi:polyribonucleotide 5'-hydroxyl-kinase
MVKNYDNKPTAISAGTGTDERISVVKLAKSGGCVDRDAAFMKKVRESQIRTYFFGTSVPSTGSSSLSLSSTGAGTTITLSPHGQQLDFDKLSIYNITIPEEDDDYDPANLGVNESFLPGGSDDIDIPKSESALPGLDSGAQSSAHQHLSSEPFPLTKLTSPPPLALQNTLLAITHAGPSAPLTEIRDASVMGFAYVASVDEKRCKINLLAPVPGRIPPRALIWGRKWPGEVVGLVG